MSGKDIHLKHQGHFGAVEVGDDELEEGAAVGYGSLDSAAGETEVFCELWPTKQWPIHLNILQFGEGGFG